jgi:hypothetical protein
MTETIPQKDRTAFRSPVHFTHTEKENAMSKLSRRSIVASAAALPALAVPAVSIAATMPPEDTEQDYACGMILFCLGERLKALMPRVAAAKLKSGMLHEEARAGLPDGYGVDDAIFRIWEERTAKNGHGQAYEEWNAVSTEQNEVARAILEIPSPDRISDGIRAAASLALNDDCENAYNMPMFFGRWPPAPASRGLTQTTTKRTTKR